MRMRIRLELLFRIAFEKNAALHPVIRSDCHDQKHAVRTLNFNRFFMHDQRTAFGNHGNLPLVSDLIKFHFTGKRNNISPNGYLSRFAHAVALVHEIRRNIGNFGTNGYAQSTLFVSSYSRHEDTVGITCEMLTRIAYAVVNVLGSRYGIVQGKTALVIRYFIVRMSEIQIKLAEVIETAVTAGITGIVNAGI